jgi:hypothetical protein
MKVHVCDRPALKNPSMVAAWPGMGMLAKISVDCLIEQLPAKLFAEIYSPRNDLYFENSIGELGFDRHRLYYWTEQQRSLILCSGENQPLSLEALYGVANKVLDIAEEYQVQRIYTFAAVPHSYTERPKVFGLVNRPQLKNFLEEKGVILADSGGRVTGLNGLLIGAAKQREIEGVCLLCEIQYMDIPQPRSAQTVLESFSRLIELHIDLSGLERQADELDVEMRRIEEQKGFRVKAKEPRYIS